LWATLFITAILFSVSAFTKKTTLEKLEKTTIDYSKKIDSFTGLSDWRLQLAFLSILTILLYIWLS
jgi:SSS family solute:Na+ symporter